MELNRNKKNTTKTFQRINIGIRTEVIGAFQHIIGRDLMVKLGPNDNFLRQILEWDETVVPMKEPSILPCKP